MRAQRIALAMLLGINPKDMRGEDAEIEPISRGRIFAASPIELRRSQSNSTLKFLSGAVASRDPKRPLEPAQSEVAEALRRREN